MRPRREIEVFSMSFIDSITCGFGAVVLLYMTLVGNSTPTSDATRTPSSEAKKIELKVSAARKNLVELNQEIKGELAQQTELAATESQLESELGTVDRKSQDLTTSAAQEREEAKRLQAELASLQADLDKQREAQRAAAEGDGNRIRAVEGNGNRQYLTAMRMGGERVVILVDCSTSMLDRTLVNIIRRRNMSEDEQRQSPKWIQTVDTVDWITAQLEPGTQYQIIGFSDHAWSLLEGTDGKWLKVTDGKQLDTAVAALEEVTPKGPTSLSLAFQAARKLNPAPDNIYLVTDGLPTMGEVTPPRAGVSGKERLDAFGRAVRELPQGVPVNVILLSMEGDPRAAPAYWSLALRTGGSMIAPSDDWP